MNAAPVPQGKAPRPIPVGVAALALIAMAVYFGIGLWLIWSAAWPAGCDIFSDPGAGRGARALEAYRCSPRLLGGGAVEIATFAWLWVFPVAVLAFLGLGRRHRRGRTR